MKESLLIKNRHGLGTLITKDGDVYRGQWQNDK